MAEEPKMRSISRKLGKKGEKAAKPQTAQDVAIRREALKEAVRRKLELEQKALLVVERLLEDSVTEEFLTDSAKLITPANYKDAVEERSIVQLCGYPVCPNKLCNVPKQKYKISTKTNKVYDITERKCFCSNFCYRASKYFEVQISKTPLWLREEDSPPDVKLLKEGESGSSGVEVKLADLPISKAEIENPALRKTEPPCDSPASGSEVSDGEQDFVSNVMSREQAELSRENVFKKKPSDGSARDRKRVTFHRAAKGDAEEEPQKVEHRQDPGTVQMDRSMQGVVVDTSELRSRCMLGDGEPEPALSEESQSTENNCLGITQVGMSKRGVERLRNLLGDLGLGADGPNKGSLDVVRNSLLEALRSTLIEWRTVETLRFLYGTSYTPGKDEDKEEEDLDEDDLEDIMEASEVAKLSGKEQQRPSASVPCYETLQKETELLNLRVREFYQGNYLLPEELDLNAETRHPDTESANTVDPVLPLVDSHSQHLIQKCIVVDKLNRSLRDIVGQLRLTMSEITTDLNNLVRTFRFTSTNIIHKNPEWTLIAVVLLFVLSEVCALLREALANPSSVVYISTLMKELGLNNEDLQELVQIFKS
ncbi:putative RNA polymerase II subunit B1 CTD phosphatase rpap2 [Arapaima gigas]